METQLIILDFGSQYTQLIARRIRECGVYCEILPYTKHEEALKAKAVILSGSPFSCLEDNAPQIAWEELSNHLPCLAVCYGAQSIAHHMGEESSAVNTASMDEANSSYPTKTRFGKALIKRLCGCLTVIRLQNFPRHFQLSQKRKAYP